MELRDAERTALAAAIETALEEAGGGGRAGIAAAILDETGRVIGEGANEVHLRHDPTRHAEIVAIGRACAERGRPDLSGCTLVSTLQPCEMCLAAMRFAGIDRVIFAATKDKVAGKYFHFPGFELADFQSASKSPFTALGGVEEGRVLHLYALGDE